MPDAPSARELADLAVAVATEAGALLLAGRAGDVVTAATKSSPTDAVTAMDTASEELVRRRLLTARPHDAVLGEEGGSVPGSSGVAWVVDPLDGTVNYLYRLPHWAVSLAAQVDGVTVAGVVHAPALGVTYRAELGGGARRDGVPLAVTGATTLGQALVATGFGYAASRRAAQAAVLARVLPAVRDIRRLGAAALDLCAVADGLVDAYYERGLNPWDLAAGALVATEAGAVVGGLDGAAASGELVVAAPPALFGPLTALLGQEPRADAG